MTSVPDIRLQARNEASLRADGKYVLYWMIAARRPRYNFALQRAVEIATEHGVGLVVFEPLRCDYQWASDRLHSFVIDGMRANLRVFESGPVTYFPYVEPNAGEGKGLLAALAAEAVAIVTDDYPCFSLPHMVEAAADALEVRLESVDGNGLMPLRAPGREFTVAHSFRRFLQKELRPHLDQLPAAEPLKGVKLPVAELPEGVARRWPRADFDVLRDLSLLPIDHSVPTAPTPGGWDAAETHIGAWIDRQYGVYEEERNHPDDDATSHISEWLHFGHLSAHEVLQNVAWREAWDVRRLSGKTDGRRGWWGMSDTGEAFMDQLVIWRELGYQWCHAHPEDYDTFDGLPDFARITLNRHAHDKRPFTYTLELFENAQTHDEVWNAAQRQLLIEGRIHNYLRMLWGKKILHWTETPQQALEFIIHLNNKYALDGRDPNSYSGIMWCLGRFDRAWGPERPVFGKVRYMTSASTRRKCRMEEYLQRYAPTP